MYRFIILQSPCADDPTKVRTVNFPAYVGQALRKKKIYGWLCWCLFLWFVSFGQAKEMNKEATVQSMQCDTFTVSGYFTSPGSCFYNVASVTSPIGTTWKDSVCVSVNYACTDSSTFIIYDSTYSTTLNYRYDTLNIFVEGTLFVNDTLKLMRCNVYMDAGAHIIVQNGGYLDIDSSMVIGCLAMWRGITVEDFGELLVHEGSTVADADTTVLANNKAKATLQNAYIKNFVLGVYVPPTTNAYYNGTTLKVEQTTFDFTTFKPNYTGQNTHGVKPECGSL